MSRVIKWRIGGAAAICAALVGLILAVQPATGDPALPESTDPDPPTVPAPEPRRPARVEPRAQPGTPIAGAEHGNKPDREQRWRKRMAEVDRRARAELAIDDEAAAELMRLQTEQRENKQRIRGAIVAAQIDAEQGAADIRELATQFRVTVAGLIGQERARKYLIIVNQVRFTDPGRKREGR